MLLFSKSGVLGTLEDLLDKERKAILGGDFEALRRMVAEKQRLLNAARGAPATQAITRLKKKAERNQAMLMAATLGIRSVADRLARAREPGAPLSTYSRTGEREAHNQTRRSMERRA